MSPEFVGPIWCLAHVCGYSGDIILLRNGDIVPADARIIPGHISNLECDEALLTGESVPVQKTTDIIKDPTCPVGDRTNMVFAGSQVTKVCL